MTENEIVEHIKTRIELYRGDVMNLEHAIGCFYIGRQLGWKIILLMHDRKSIKKYEQLLDLDFRVHMPDIGVLAHKSLAWRAVQKVSSYWKAVKGEIANIRTPQVD
ncbi:hypothetical protein [Nitrosomonas sp.]|uniref:hypothetical protein n=1 Tax=Nitrosomonas sp. TaxID=42353 RepID=UPI001DA4C468|nr:hypothetical protein [Nitrosomonas sp.]MBX3616618.1 hypothetical protein [Nitrosomonas sp.]